MLMGYQHTDYTAVFQRDLFEYIRHVCDSVYAVLISLLRKHIHATLSLFPLFLLSLLSFPLPSELLFFLRRDEQKFCKILPMKY